MGKIVIKFPHEDVLPLTKVVPEPSFRSDSSYLLVGGTGGLGKAIASWMVRPLFPCLGLFLGLERTLPFPLDFMNSRSSGIYRNLPKN
jgi:hypothetical protein